MSPEPSGELKETAEDLNTAAGVQVDVSGPEPMTEAEQAAAEALARHFNLNYSDGIERPGPVNWGPEARAVVAAVRELIAAEALEAMAEELRKGDPADPGAVLMLDADGLDECAAALRTTTPEHKGDPR
ncbi:hypothetical protein ADL26_07575 [Thermoactinomyces vulgaris]|nr:hypothetical protein ADL26_07575 [Thermoactinomyces vulgaris]